MEYLRRSNNIKAGNKIVAASVSVRKKMKKMNVKGHQAANMWDEPVETANNPQHNEYN